MFISKTEAEGGPIKKVSRKRCKRNKDGDWKGNKGLARKLKDMR